MFSRELETTLGLMDHAGRVALEVHNREFTVEQKKNRDPVTEADKALNTYLVGALRDAFPNDLVVGEESGHTAGVDAERAWFVDPIDGTSDFIKKNGEWSIMVGLVVDGRAKLGVVAQPVTGDLYWAVAGGGAWHRMGISKRQLRVSDEADTALATVVNSRSHPDPRIQAVLERLGITRQYEHGSVGCKLAQISEKRADLYFNFSGKCHMWDTCGPEVIIREAGGVLVDFDGQPIAYRGDTTRVTMPFVATTQRLAPRVLDTLRAMRDQLGPDEDG